MAQLFLEAVNLSDSGLGAGMKISQFVDLLNDVHNICRHNRHFDLCLVDLGCNDFNNETNDDTRHLVNFVLDLAEMFLVNGVKRVALMEMTFRKG